MATLDQVDINNNDFFILRNQTDLSENGIYKKTNTGSIEKQTSSAYISSQNINYIYFVNNGVVNKGKYY